MKRNLALRISFLFYAGTILSATMSAGMALMGFDEGVPGLMFCTMLFLGLGISIPLCWWAYY